MALFHDLRAVFRRLLRSPTFTGLSVLTLAIGIGANSAIFSLVDGVLLRPLAFPESERLVGLWHTAPGLEIPQFEQSDATYLLYREENRVFEDVAAYRAGSLSLTGGEQPERVRGAEASPSLFPVLRVTPVLGRGFTPEETSPGAEPTVVVSHELWERRLGGRREALGQVLRVDGVARTVVGVMPAGFSFPGEETQLWIPLEIDPATVAEHAANFNFNAIARLRPGIDAAAAEADLAGLVRRIPEVYSEGPLSAGMLEQARLGVIVRSLLQDTVGDVGGVLWVLFGTVGVILLIACANVANLFLVRAERRQRETALRTALGATRGSLAGVFLGESTVLGLAAGALGLAFAGAGVRLLRQIVPDHIPRLGEVSIDTRVLGFTLVVSLAAALLFGSIPFWRRPASPALALRDGGRSSTAGRLRLRARTALVVMQIALALVLLVSSGLMLRSFRALRNLDPGFDASGVLTLAVALPESAYPEPDGVEAFYRDVLDRVRALPGVESAGGVHILPLGGGGDNSGRIAEGHPVGPDEVPPLLGIRYVAPGYHETLGIPLVAGRLLERADIEEERPVIVVSRSVVERFWPGEDGLGRHIRGYGPEDDQHPWYEIVGVVGEVRDDSLEAEPREMAYYPLRTPPEGDRETSRVQRSLTLVVRGSVPPTSLADPVRRAIWSVDRNIPVANVRPMSDILAAASARTAYTTLLLGLAAAIAILLGSVGLYGVISFVVSQRTQEIGVRMALGADRGTVRRMILGHGLRTALVGLVLGLAGAFAVTRWLTASLHGVSPTDPLTFGAVSALLLAVALLATYLPARRASRVEPLVALRYE